MNTLSLDNFLAYVGGVFLAGMIFHNLGIGNINGKLEVFIFVAFAYFCSLALAMFFDWVDAL